MAYYDKYGVEFSDDRKTLVKCPKDISGKYIIPFGVETIGKSAFRHSSIHAIDIPDSITYIEDGAFYDCDSLKEIVVPSGQKERFMKMNALSDYKDIIIDEDQRERIMASQSMDAERIRVWEECVAEWEKCKQCFKSNKAIYDMIEAGSVPASFPPIGVCLTIAEYNQFKSEKRDLQKIQGWCYSGKNFHATVRLFSHLPNNLNTTGVGNMIGLKTPRKGFCRVIDVLDDKECTLVCYYNYHDPDEFVEEEVEISSRPLYNKSSIGPKDHLLKVGDILHVKEDVKLVEAKYDGKVYTTYKIVWEYEN